jgi:hypothetical protein
LRDFKARDIGGDVIINDNPQEHKLLIHCSNEELYHEEEHRNNILRKEKSRKNNVTLKFLGISGVLFLIASAWFYFKGEMNAVSLLVGGASAIFGFATLQQADVPTEFERRQLAVLHEIHMLLRERGAR